MSQVLYTVTATVPGEDLACEYIDWLTGGHIQAVLAGGAATARVVRLDAEAVTAPQVEVQYVFPSPAALDQYVRDVAPALRQEGVERFASRGVTFARRIGRVVAAL